MRKIALFSLLIFMFLILVPFVNGAEVLGVSPGCILLDGQNCTYYPINMDEIETFEIHVFNLFDSERSFSIRAENALENNTAFSPETFTLNNKYDRSVTHKGCVLEEGCQIVLVTVDTAGLKPGNYETLLITNTEFSESGSLALNAEVGVRLLVQVQENTMYRMARILKENLAITLSVVVLVLAGLLFIFKKQIKNLVNNKPSKKRKK